MWVFALSNALLLATLLTLSHGLLKWVASHTSKNYIQTLLEYWWVIGLAISVYVFIFFYYAYVLRTVDIAILYPIYTGLSIIFVFLMGIYFFGESTSTWQLLGCGLIMSGIILVSGVVK